MFKIFHNRTFRSIMTIFFAVGFTWFITACDGESETPVADLLLCQKLEDRVYLSETIEESGRSENGEVKNHWRVQFKNGVMEMMQSDFGIAAEYRCENEQVFANITNQGSQALNFSSDHEQLYLNPLGNEALTYTLMAENSHANIAACNAVRGKQYAQVTSAATMDDSASPIAPPISLSLQFSDNRVAISQNEEQLPLGYYDCALDQLHIHTNEDDISPMLVEVSENGSELVVQSQLGTHTLIEASETIACPEVYIPVCGIKPQNIQCLVAPCPIGIYKTYSSQCHANAANAQVVFNDECGNIEGQPVYDNIACTKEYIPVCAAIQTIEPCTELPCPNVIHKSFGNLCEANAAGSLSIIKEGECGELENQGVTQLEGSCIAVIDPVCAKDEAQIACVTTPCPSHSYQNMNRCDAGLALASIAFDGECGNLNETLAFAQPPAKIVANNELPQTDKTPRFSAVEFTDDVLHVTLSYSGCNEQHFELFVGRSFLESNPVQANYVFKPLIEDDCDATFQTRLSFDLQPLKHAYRELYQSRAGSILLPDLGLYTFP